MRDVVTTRCRLRFVSSVTTDIDAASQLLVGQVAVLSLPIDGTGDIRPTTSSQSLTQDSTLAGRIRVPHHRAALPDSRDCASPVVELVFLMAGMSFRNRQQPGRHAFGGSRRSCLQRRSVRARRKERTAIDVSAMTGVSVASGMKGLKAYPGQSSSNSRVTRATAQRSSVAKSARTRTANRARSARSSSTAPPLSRPATMATVRSRRTPASSRNCWTVPYAGRSGADVWRHHPIRPHRKGVHLMSRKEHVAAVLARLRPPPELTDRVFVGIANRDDTGRRARATSRCSLARPPKRRPLHRPPGHRAVQVHGARHFDRCRRRRRPRGRRHGTATRLDTDGSGSRVPTHDVGRGRRTAVRRRPHTAPLLIPATWELVTEPDPEASA